MGAARVSIGKFEGKHCVYKQGASAVELNFYLFAAQELVGVNCSKVFDVTENNLVIEYVPYAVNLAQLYVNTSTFEQLVQIHHANYQPNFPVKKHLWSARSTELALDTLCFPEVTQDTIKIIQDMSCELFEHKSLVSGDSNEGNWGVRKNGELVLFDWERFGFGSPAIDLAPLVKGLGTCADYDSIITKYSRYSSHFSDVSLQRHLILAKVWIVVEVTNILIRNNKPSATKYIRWFRENVPNWLIKVEKAL